MLRFVRGGVCTRESFVGLGKWPCPGNGSESGCSGMASGLRGADSVAVCVVLDVMHNLVELEDTQETSGPCERGVKHPPGVDVKTTRG